MISFLFWNLARNERAIPCLARLALTYTVDVFLLAECPTEVGAVATEVTRTGRGAYLVADALRPKVQVISRLPAGALRPRFTGLGSDMTIWKLEAGELPFVLLAAVHLPAKVGGVKDSDQQSWAEGLAREIAQIEDEEQTRNTLLVGDLNMNPFDPGIVSVTGCQGLMTKELAALKDRKHRGRHYRRFYNPMWGLFGDRTPGPAGTHYWSASVPSNQHWHVFDQVLLRPALARRLRNLQILDGDGYQSFLSEGIASKEYLSDHLPILFQLDL